MALVSIMVFVLVAVFIFVVVSSLIPIMAPVIIVVGVDPVRIPSSDVPAAVQPTVLMSGAVSVCNGLIPRHVMMMSPSRRADSIIPVAVRIHRVRMIVRSHLGVVGVSCPAVSCSRAVIVVIRDRLRATSVVDRVGMGANGRMVTSMVVLVVAVVILVLSQR